MCNARATCAPAAAARREAAVLTSLPVLAANRSDMLASRVDLENANVTTDPEMSSKRPPMSASPVHPPFLGRLSSSLSLLTMSIENLPADNAGPAIFDSLPYYDNELEQNPFLREKVEKELAREAKPSQAIHPRVPPPVELFSVRTHSCV